MSQRIDSEKISKVLLLIISGLKAGGNISDLLEETSRNMKEKEIIEKKASSSILMYVIFIFFAVGVGAPILFGLGSVLAEIIINLAARMPDLSATQMDLPFTFNQIAISKNFIVYFAVTFIIVSDLISCLIIGLVNKGNSKSGLKLFIPLLVLSLTIFTVVKTFLSKVLLNAIAPG
jgi:type II secretory pathway component PulF